MSCRARGPCVMVLMLLWSAVASVGEIIQDSGGAVGTCSAAGPEQSGQCTQGSSYIQRAQLVQKMAVHGKGLQLNDEQTSALASAGNRQCAPYSQWPDVDNGVTCDSCTALVLTEPYGNRCDEYCASFGHVCVAAAEERAESCDVKDHLPCDAVISRTSDMLCTCHLPEVPPTASCCSPFTEWPDVDNGVTCDACTALVLTEPHQNRCDVYCESFGHVCVAAAEERNEGCDVIRHVPCDQVIPRTSDMLCTCHLPAGSTCPSSSTPPATVPPGAVLPTAAPGTMPRVQVRGRQVLVNGQPVHLKGVAWNPVPRGGVHPNDVDFAGFVDQDAELMQRAGINAVRTYVTIEDTVVLDKLQAHGIWVLNDVYAYGGTAAEVAVDRVRSVKNHPAILMWTVGNEWNYNGLYVNMGSREALERVRRVAGLVKAEDPTRPVASIYGEVPSREVFESLDSVVDVWGLNVYRGLSFGNVFDVYTSRSGKPMFFGEYGADAFNANIHREDQEAQAEATTALSQEIAERSSMLPGGICLGGFIFEFADEWWKDHSGDKNAHDTGGVAPGGGPHPDRTFNEEWWGLVAVDRTPRLAYSAYRQVEVPSGSPRP